MMQLNMKSRQVQLGASQRLESCRRNKEPGKIQGKEVWDPSDNAHLDIWLQAPSAVTQPGPLTLQQAGPRQALPSSVLTWLVQSSSDTAI